MTRPPNPATLAARLEMERSKVRASFLQARHRQITARIARMHTQPATLIQLELPLAREEKAS